MPPGITFITGTDTGVGKTVLTALLLEHLLQGGVKALAMKPFCCGGRGDVELIQAIQDSRLPDGAINPFYFADPLSPLMAARKARRAIALADALQKIRAVQRQCDRLLIEGAGGIMAPLGEGFRAIDLIGQLGSQIIVVGRNRLGVLNHVLLTVEAARSTRLNAIKVVLMGAEVPDPSRSSNSQLLAEILAPLEVLQIPFLGRNASTVSAVKKNAKKLKKVLAQLLR